MDYMNKKDPKLPFVAKKQFASMFSKLKETMKEPSLKQLYEKRHIFVIADGQDILSKNLQFSYVEINDRLSKFVP
jgi:hypothetical protein